MIWILPDWVWWAVLTILGITIGYQLALYRFNKAAWMNKWFDGPLDIVPSIKKYFQSVKSDLKEMKKG
ncbi:hypothetical protein [Lentilactobacillus buchneri]|uniref:hypothetical protein n=1 Tax=Lentilactobacillus buchneri TaxID=1581 RepID=UPI0021A6CBBF|nr:hypothetical protein [Lentilactobacillus buchneri]MCT2882637.1 hypothetical protein [Lentilactobacillus buchneri]